MNCFDGSILKKLFEMRDEEIAIIEEYDKSFINQDEANRSKKLDKLICGLEKLEVKSDDEKKNILKLIEDYIDSIDCQNSYFNEKYYFEGLKDGFEICDYFVRSYYLN